MRIRYPKTFHQQFNQPIIMAVITVFLLFIYLLFKNTVNIESNRIADRPIVPTPTDIPKTTPSKVVYTPSPTNRPKGLTPAISKIPQTASLTQLIYPASQVKESSSTQMTLTSSESTDTITTWYKNKLDSMNMTVKTTVKTKANENVKNTLVSANASEEIRVEIIRNAQDSVATIKIYRIPS